MFFFQIDFNDGRAHEYQASNEQIAVHWGKQKMRSWNQPSAIISRTAPNRPEFKKVLTNVENPEFDPTQPRLEKDPRYEYRVPTRKVRKRKDGSKSSGTTGPRVTHPVPLKAIADKLEVSPTVLRRKLRSADIEKPSGGWGWDSWEHEDVNQILSWYQKK